MRPRRDALAVRREALAATVSPSRRRLRRSARGPDDFPTTTCHRVSSGILKVPPDDRTDACGVSDALPNEGSPGTSNRSSRIPETEIVRLGRGLVTKPSTAIENMILK